MLAVACCAVADRLGISVGSGYAIKDGFGKCSFDGGIKKWPRI
jgi:hypothetical protein